jgi:RNA polymerase sigma factor (sigma-70 family)
MDQLELANVFDQQRRRLGRVAYRMLGSVGDADDAVQEAWIRLQQTEVADIDNLEAWLTTVLARICLNMLRARASRAKQELGNALIPEPLVELTSGEDPEHAALLADAVGIALQVVLETLSPAERLAFVLHDMFEVPFDEIAPLVQRTSEATRQLASRARRRIKDAAPDPDADLSAQRRAVDAYFAAAREGDLDALVAVLAPDVVLRAHSRGVARELRGTEQVALGAVAARAFAPYVRPALINGAAGVVAFDGDQPFAILAFTVVAGRIAAVDIFNDRELVPPLLQGRHPERQM